MMTKLFVSREDGCIWINDNRGEPGTEVNIHLVPSQALELADALRTIASAGERPPIGISGTE